MVNPNTRTSLFTPVMKRGFATAPPVNNMPAYLMGAIGLGGLAYVSFMGSEMSGGQGARLQHGEVRMSNFVQQRMGKTFGYFGYGILSTSAFIYTMRNSMAWASMSPWLLFGGSIALLFGTHALNYETQFIPKMLVYTAFTGVMGMSILPLI